jgi:phosphatidylinositol alpha-1,6-mannosyltransferase
MLAIVTDANGGRGGIAQDNRNFLGALSETGFTSSITVVPQHAPDPPTLSEGIKQLQTWHGRLLYSRAALRGTLFGWFDLVFCGHLFMAQACAACGSDPWV